MLRSLLPGLTKNTGLIAQLTDKLNKKAKTNEYVEIDFFLLF